MIAVLHVYRSTAKFVEEAWKSVNKTLCLTFLGHLLRYVMIVILFFSVFTCFISLS